MTFSEFLHAYRTDTLDKDPAWRAYDIQGAATPRHARFALKVLGMAYAGELAVPEAMARYAIKDRSEAEAVLGAWWLWSQIDQGRFMRVPRRARGERAGWLNP